MEKEKIWCIYCHTNKINDKKYIGYTVYSDNLERRWIKGCGYKRHPRFYNAIKKYGWENFSHEVIETGITDYALICEREKYWIAYYHTFIEDPECNGYNMTPGGEGIYSGFKHSEESKEKMRLAKLGKIKSPETCKKLSQSKMGHSVSDEARYHMSISHIGLTYPVRSEASRQRSSKAQLKKPIICIETGIVYEGTTIAAKALQIGRSAICNCVNGISNTAGGYHWKFFKK